MKPRPLEGSDAVKKMIESESRMAYLLRKLRGEATRLIAP